MAKKIWEETWEVMVEGFTDIFMLAADLITAPFMAVCRVVSDFLHREGRYSRSDRGSPSSH